MYELVYYPEFKRRLKKFAKKDKSLRLKFSHVFNTMMEDPFHRSLRTHKVDATKYGKKWSSRVTGNLRIIWGVDKTRTKVILLLTIGGHSGKSKVYK